MYDLFVLEGKELIGEDLRGITMPMFSFASLQI